MVSANSSVHSRDVTPGVKCEGRADQVAERLGKSRPWVDSMLIHREGLSSDANMTAIGLHTSVQNLHTYRVSAQTGLNCCESDEQTIDLESAAQSATQHTPPPHVLLTALWDYGAVVDRDAENILGDNVIFQIQSQETEAQIPVIEATADTLGYYGAVFVTEGERVRFPNPEYPIWKMELGRRYIDGFIMTPEGKGFYLEYHHDRPHWHQPLTADCGGYYLLARALTPSIPSSHVTYQVTGFSIPFGAAVYTGQGVIHCDAALTGKNWLVGYTDSNDFSTALVRNEDGEMVKLSGLKTGS